jgi:hypothetical protein
MAATIFSGTKVKTLKNILSINGGAELENSSGTLLFKTGSTERLRINTSGFVGINTTGITGGVPESELHVATNSTASVRGFVLDQYNSGSQSVLAMFRKSRAGGTVVNGDSGMNLVSLFHDGTSYVTTARISALSNGAVSTGSVPTDIVFYAGTTTATERFRIGSGGDVQIGTTAVAGGLRYFDIYNNSGTASTGILIRQITSLGSGTWITYNSGESSLRSNQGSGSYVTLSCNDSEKMRVTNDGNVGIGGSSFASGQCVIFLAGAIAPPSGTPSGGGIIYVQSGALRYKSPGGTDTQIAPN